MPLTLVEVGRCVRLKAIALSEPLTKKLTAMGLIPGARLEICPGSNRRVLVVSVMGSRIMLDNRTASSIFVS